MQPGIAAGNPATAAAGAEILGERRQRGGRRGCGDARLVCGGDDHDRAARRRARDLLRRRVGTVVEPRLLLLGPFRRGRRAGRTSRCRSARSTSTTRSGRVVRGPRRRRRRRRAARAVRPAAVARRVRAGDAACAWRRRDGAGPRVVPRDARAGHDDGRGRAHLRAGQHACCRRATRFGSPGSRRRSHSSSPRARRRCTPARSRSRMLSLMRARGGIVTADDLCATTRRSGASRSRSSTSAYRVLHARRLVEAAGPAAAACEASRV